MDTKPAPIFTIPPEKGPNRLCRLLLRPTHSLIERAMGLREVDNIYSGACRLNPEKPFSDRILASMGVAYTYSETDLAGVPKTGPVVVVANHPFGGVEGIVLLSLLRRVRPDVRVMANYLLHAIPEMRDDFIFVDPFGSTGSARANLKPIKECMAWLKQGGLLIVFRQDLMTLVNNQASAGTVSAHRLPRRRGVRVRPPRQPRARQRLEPEHCGDHTEDRGHRRAHVLSRPQQHAIQCGGHDPSPPAHPDAGATIGQQARAPPAGAHRFSARLEESGRHRH